ncbi:MAG TPA: hypothetical protein VGD67_12090 [Pseudonocardiaceae bacterium]
MTLLELCDETGAPPVEALAFSVQLCAELGDAQVVVANPAGNGRTFTTPDGTYDDFVVTDVAATRIRERFAGR